ncbi:MAG: hypothetical protein WCK84_10550 [Bacteroidota bacterium]
MQSINRDAITVSARKPMIDWVNSMDPGHPINYRDPSNYDESTVYLIEQLETEEDFNDWIMENYLEIFEEELFNWITDDLKWPAPLTYELFTQWIQVSYQSMVVDLHDDEPIEYDE